MAITKRWHAKKENLGNFETADFGAEGEKVTWDELFKDIAEGIKQFTEIDLNDPLPPITVDEWEAMPPEVQSHYQEIKKAENRIRYHKGRIEKYNKDKNKS